FFSFSPFFAIVGPPLHNLRNGGGRMVIKNILLNGIVLHFLRICSFTNDRVTASGATLSNGFLHNCRRHH
ncbi:MAG: hypothetical protein D3916_09620, partial [Candidatus Electrothrix sp. MAN1_4]|nr:hypothetical protein [Candidatus Electrothrix sp. MAN1_4]